MIGLLKKVIYLPKFSGSWSNLHSSSGYGQGPAGKGVSALGPVQVIILSVGFDKDSTRVSNSLTRSQEGDIKNHNSSILREQKKKTKSFFGFFKRLSRNRMWVNWFINNNAKMSWVWADNSTWAKATDTKWTNEDSINTVRTPWRSSG